jgi:hemerythrin
VDCCAGAVIERQAADKSGMAAASALITWKDSYSVRIPRIDAQHKRLIDSLNQLHAAMQAGKAQEALAEVLEDLVRYTETHFASEERLMTERGYSGLAGHREQHRGFATQAQELRGKFRAGRLAVGIETLQFLRNWLTNHILNSDMAYAREFEKR